jgi:hypothetical protein
MHQRIFLAKPGFNFIIAVALLCGALNTRAVTILWANPVTNNWGFDTNWNPVSIPGGADIARINNGGTAVIDSSVAAIPQFLELGNAGSTTGTVAMTGGTLTTGSDIRVGGNTTTGGGFGNFNQSGGVIVLNGGNFNTGQGATAKGTYNLSGGSMQVSSGTFLTVGNRGTGTINQSGGTIYIRGGATPLAAVVQLGRNTTTTFGSGTYNLSGGLLMVAQVQFGNAVDNTGLSTNNFNLQGTGRLVTGTVSTPNTAAANAFRFTGGTLTANSIGLSLTNTGGILSPGTATFAGAGDINSVPFNPVGTNVFTGANSYVQGVGATLAIDIAGAGSNDFVDIGSGAPVGVASVAGTISVTLLNGYNPAPGLTFDILTADTITNSATVSGMTLDGSAFQPSIVTGGDGRMVLRLTVGPSRPRIAGFALVGGAFQLSFAGVSGGLYQIVTSADIAIPLSSWAVMGNATETPSGSGQFSFTDPAPSSFGQRFYSVHLP